MYCTRTEVNPGSAFMRSSNAITPDLIFSTPLRRSFRAGRASCSSSRALSISLQTNVAAASIGRIIARIAAGLTMRGGR